MSRLLLKKGNYSIHICQFIFNNIVKISILKRICYASTKYVFIIRMGKINGYFPFQNQEGELKPVVIIDSSY